ncbi:hypothetical protein UPYG_G00170050 [Umbra pygmaea]|uniref:Cyclin-dependent kinase inhibitor domain-containing protein n=1 Tax=Umbra pygmaea TaxID=75934 RepID=A0ABD0WPB3_UMBPY
MCRTRKTMVSRKRLLSPLEKCSARRMLFGPVDPEQLQKEYQDALSRDLELACHRWGFDFRSEEPLAGGDFQWERVPDTNVPLPYRPCLVGLGGAQGVGGLADMSVQVGLSQCGKESPPCTPEKYTAKLQDVETTPDKENGLKRKQTDLTDFYQAKKRVVDTPRKSGQ